MSLPDFDALTDRIATEGLGQGEDMLSLRHAFERSVIEAALAYYPSHTAAAAALNVTREGLYRTRKRLGIRATGNDAKAIPADWRERLRPPPPSSRPTEHDRSEG